MGTWNILFPKSKIANPNTKKILHFKNEALEESTYELLS